MTAVTAPVGDVDRRVTYATTTPRQRRALNTGAALLSPDWRNSLRASYALSGSWPDVRAGLAVTIADQVAAGCEISGGLLASYRIVDRICKVRDQVWFADYQARLADYRARRAAEGTA